MTVGTEVGDSTRSVQGHERRAPWVSRVGWCATVVAAGLVPVLFLRLGTNVFFLPKLTLLWLCTALGVAGVIIDRRAGPAWPRIPAVAIPVAAFVVVMTIATAVSSRPWVALMGRYGRHAGLVSLVTYVTFGAVVYLSCAGRPHRLIVLARAVVASGVVGSLYVLLQVIGLDFDWTHTIGAQLPYFGHMGALGNSNFAGAHLAIAIPLLLLLRCEEHDRRLQLAATAAIPIVVLGLAFTETRGGWIAALVGAGATMLLNPRLAPRWLTIAVTTLALLGLASVAFVAVTRTDSTYRPLEAQSVLRRQTMEQRVDLWVAAVDVARDHPWTGTGPDTFAQELPSHASAAPDLTNRPEPFDAPHNIFLAHLAAAGLPGAAAWLAVVVTAWVAAIRARRALAHDRVAVLAGFGGGFAAYLAQGMVSIDVVPLAFLGWLLLAGLVSAGATEPQPRSPRPVPLWFTATVLVLAAVVIAAAVLPFLADVRMQQAMDSPRSVRDLTPEAYLDDLGGFETFNRSEPRLYLEAARTALDGGEQLRDRASRIAVLKGALASVDRSLALQPGEVDAELVKARVLERLGAAGEPGAFDQAEQMYRSIEAHDPHDPQVRLDHIRFLRVWQRATGVDRTSSVREEADAIGAIPFSWAQGWYELARVYRDLGDQEAALAAVTKSLRLNAGDPRAAALRDELRRQ